MHCRYVSSQGIQTSGWQTLIYARLHNLSLFSNFAFIFLCKCFNMHKKIHLRTKKVHLMHIHQVIDYISAKRNDYYRLYKVAAFDFSKRCSVLCNATKNIISGSFISFYCRLCHLLNCDKNKRTTC